jgi:hypothetical protein
VCRVALSLWLLADKLKVVEIAFLDSFHSRSAIWRQESAKGIELVLNATQKGLTLPTKLHAEVIVPAAAKIILRLTHLGTFTILNSMSMRYNDDNDKDGSNGMALETTSLLPTTDTTTRRQSRRKEDGYDVSRGGGGGEEAAVAMDEDEDGASGRTKRKKLLVLVITAVIMHCVKSLVCHLNPSCSICN